MSHSIRDLLGGRGLAYGAPGPGVECPGSSEQLPRVKRRIVVGDAADRPAETVIDAMGKRVFAQGIHAGIRIAPQDDQTCEADRIERETLREVLLDADPVNHLSMSDFRSEQVPLRDTHYQAMPFRPDDHAGQTVERTNDQWTDEIIRVADQSDADIGTDPEHWFIMVSRFRRTAIEVTTRNTSKPLGFHPQIGWFASRSEIAG